MILLLITGSYREMADRRMTTTVKRVLAPACVPGSTSLGRPWMGQRVRHRGAVPQRGPSPVRLHLGAPRRLALCVRAAAQTSAVPARRFGTLGAPGTWGTRRRRTLGRLAGDQGDAWPPGQVPASPSRPTGQQAWSQAVPLVAKGARDCPRLAPPRGPSMGWPWPPGPSPAAAGLDAVPVPRPATPRPHAPARWLGGPPPPACPGSPPPRPRAPGRRGRFGRGVCGRGAGRARRAAGDVARPALPAGVIPGSSRQGCKSNEVKVLCRQLPGSDG